MLSEAKEREVWKVRSGREEKIVWSGCSHHVEAQSRFQPGLKYSVAWPLDHHVDGNKLPVCGTDLYRFRIQIRCGLLSKAAVTSAFQGSQLLNHPMVIQVRGGGVRLCWTSE